MIEAFERAPLDKICAFDNLIHLWPLSAYSVNNEYFLVSPKYPIALTKIMYIYDPVHIHAYTY